MTRRMMWMGFVATVLICVSLLAAFLREPGRQSEALAVWRAAALVEAADLYAIHCVECHGAAGEGLDVYPILDSAYVQGMDEALVQHTIERGRYNTAMAGFSLDEGGPLTPAQIQTLTVLLRHGDWNRVAARVAELGLTPPEVEIVAADGDDVLVSAAGLDLAGAYDNFLNLCSSCHGERGQGTYLAPALNGLNIRRTLPAKLLDIITVGVSNTEMEGYGNRLSQPEKDSLVYLLQHWDLLDQPGGLASMAVVLTPENPQVVSAAAVPLPTIAPPLRDDDGREVSASSVVAAVPLPTIAPPLRD